MMNTNSARFRIRVPRLRLAGVALISSLSLLALGGCGGPVGDVISVEGRVSAPDFQLATVTGETFGSQAVAGKVVVLDFWATWCGPCHIQAEILHEIYDEYRGPHFEILSIDTNEELDKVQAFAEKNPAPYPVLVDTEGAVGDEFGVVGLPTIVLLDREGRIAFSHTGVVEADELRPLIEKELGDGQSTAG